MKTLVLLLCYAMTVAAVTFETAFSPRGGAEALIIKTIDSAKKTIYVAAYSFTSKPIAAALIRANDRGVFVNIVVDSNSNYNPARSVIDECDSGGCGTVLNGQYQIMHNKFMVIDSCTIETGSFNYSASAESSNAENVVVMKNAPRAVVKAYLQTWSRLWSRRKLP